MTYGSLPAVGRIFYGVTPVLIAIIAQALWGLGRAAMKYYGPGGPGARPLLLAGEDPAHVELGR